MSELNPKKTALLLLDIQPSILARLPVETSESVIGAAASAVKIARKYGATVSHVRVALHESELAGLPGYQEAYSGIKKNPGAGPAIHPDAPGTQVHAAIAPADGESVHRKIRYGAFMRGPATALLHEYKAGGVENIVIGGIITSGAVLSAVRQLADLDFHLFLLEDVCADPDTELHEVLMEKILSKQSTLIKSTELNALLSK